MRARILRGALLPWLMAVLLLVGLIAGCGSPAANNPAPDQTPTENGTPTPATPADAQPQPPANPDVILATTTSTQDSGLLDVLVPMFEQQTGYRVKTIAVGTGAALAMGEKGEADVLLVHAPEAEQKVVDAGAAVNRRLVMHNDFIIVGPAGDPAGVKGTKTAAEAFQKIAGTGSLFISRGDDSGTHKKELAIWKAAHIEPAGGWYQESGSGMGQTLLVASEKNAYTLTDRATFLAARQNLSLEVVLEGDAPLLNIYHVMEVNPEKFSKVNAAGARAFADFLLSPEAQDVISHFGADQYGQPLFVADAGKSEAELQGQP